MSKIKKLINKLESKVKCYDCGLDYTSEAWVEAVIPDKIWNDISPTKNDCGLLCINCIAKRLKEKGYDNVPVWLVGVEPFQAKEGNLTDEKDIQILRNYDLKGK